MRDVTYIHLTSRTTIIVPGTINDIEPAFCNGLDAASFRDSANQPVLIYRRHVTHLTSGLLPDKPVPDKSDAKPSPMPPLGGYSLTFGDIRRAFVDPADKFAEAAFRMWREAMQRLADGDESARPVAEEARRAFLDARHH